MKPAILIITLLLGTIRNDPIGDLQTTASSYVIQELADYQFTLSFNGDGISNYTVPTGSELVIYLPS